MCIFRFYLKCILPEIVNPLYGKRLPISDIRKPCHILEMQKQHKTKKVFTLKIKK